MLDDIFAQWQAIWAAFDKASPLANALQIGSFLLALVSSTRWYVHRRLHDKDGRIQDLEETLADRNKKLDESRLRLRDSDNLGITLRAQLPQTALEAADQERSNGNDSRANDALLEWLESAGEPISELLLRRAIWAASHAAGESRAHGLVVAEANAIAATVFDPETRAGISLTDEIERVRTLEGQLLPDLQTALGEFDDRVEAAFMRDRAEEAAELQAQAELEHRRGHYHLALSQIERVILLWSQTVGPKGLSTLRARLRRSSVLDDLGQYHEALQESQAIVEVLTKHPDIGPDHPVTLESRHQVGLVLGRMGRYDEALQGAEAVFEACMKHPNLGVAHPSTLGSRHQLALILQKLGRYDEALTETEAVIEAFTKHPDLGRDHPDTLASRYQVALVLGELGRDGEALKESEAVVEARTQHPNLGPDHPDTLASRYQVALVLGELGRDDEALKEAEAVVEAQTRHPNLGQDHPDTLASIQLLADIRDSCGD